jgi:hypothetical protein
MNTFGDIRARFARILEHGLNENVEKKDMAGLIKYLKDLKGVPREDTIFKVDGKIIPRPEIDKLIDKEGITFGDDTSKSNEDSSEKMGKLSARVEDKVKDIKDPIQKENAEMVLSAVKVFNDPNASMEDKVKQVEKLNDAGLIFRNSESAKSTKMYLDPSATGYIKPIPGWKRRIPSDLRS